jgi:hypothetical protein
VLKEGAGAAAKACEMAAMARPPVLGIGGEILSIPFLSVRQNQRRFIAALSSQ